MSNSDEDKIIPKEQRAEMMDTMTRPSVSTSSAPPEPRFQRERREMSEALARKTIADPARAIEPMNAKERKDLMDTVSRKTVLDPLSKKERRELARSISIVEPAPEVPLWNMDPPDMSESDERRPVNRTRVLPSRHKQKSEAPKPLSKRERRELVRSISIAEPAPEIPLWDKDPSDVSEHTESRPSNSARAHPLLPKHISDTAKEPLSKRERRELARSISISEPEIPVWETDGANVSQAREPSYRARATPPTPPPTESVSDPLSKKERRELARSISIAVPESEIPIWDMDLVDLSESEEPRPLNRPRATPPPPDFEVESVKPKPSKLSSKKFRTVRVHVSDLARSHAIDSFAFCDNKVQSSKYSLATFLPMNLFMQCTRAANLYFILIAAIQLIPGFSPTSWGTTMGPLSFVLLLNASKEAIDDFKRNLSDIRVNKQKVEVLKDGEFVPMNWGSVVVGDIVRVKCDHEFPADLVFLSSSDPKGLAYVETSNLDGEPSLKVRNAFYQGSTGNDDDETPLSIFSGLTLECELPNNRLYKFEGAINLQDYGKLPLDGRQILLRGATLRNTEWIFGVVVYTGADTKFVRNMIPGQFKVTELERNVNIVVALVFLCQVALCVGLAVGQDRWQRNKDLMYYIPNAIWSHIGPAPSEIGAQFGRFLILLNQLIPISLYITLEVVRVVQSYLLDRDIQMYHEPTKTYARARTTNLNEELGQVQYVLTDKTGTLTQNLMAFVQCSIGGVVYGNVQHEDAIQLGPTKNTIHTVSQDATLVAVIKALAEGSKEIAPKACLAFFSHLAICHTVFPGALNEETVGKVEESKLKYSGASPDEEALVQGAADCGFQLKKRAADELQIYIPGLGLQKFAILAVLEFTSERKRMSIICRDMKGRIKLYCKGADTVIFKRLGGDQSSTIEATLKQLEDFARCGYRTLCMAEREISNGEYEQWAAQFRAASVALDDRDEKVAGVAEAIERDMTLLGATAVEDKLQGGVPETVTVLAQAGIKIWCSITGVLKTAFQTQGPGLDQQQQALCMTTLAKVQKQKSDFWVINLRETATNDGKQLTTWNSVPELYRGKVLTGDKLETSVSVALSCNLLADSMHLFLLSDGVAKSVPQMLRSMLDEARRQQHAKSRMEGSYHSDMATVIEGSSLSIALEDSNKLVFLQLCQLCRSVVCCRVSPIQKAQVARLVKENGNAVTLAIGDGANDVGMLKVAQIGVGIGGREGMAAVLASDYAITRFRFLGRLLLVHGRWSYKRNRELVMYAFYKNIVYVLGNVYLAFFSGFSAQTLYSAAEISSFNLIWTSLPTLAFAVLEKDLSDCTAENNPQLYLETQSEQRGQFLWCMGGWFACALLDSLVAFFFPLFVGCGLQKTGESPGIWSLGSTAFTMAIFIVNLRVILRMHTLTWLHFVALNISTSLWLLSLYLLSFSFQWINYFADLEGVGSNLTAAPSFWFLLLLCPIAAILPVATLEVFRNRSDPVDSDIMREIEHGWLDGFYFEDAEDFVEQIVGSEPGKPPGTEFEDGPSPLQKEIAASRQAVLADNGDKSPGTSTLGNVEGEDSPSDSGRPANVNEDKLLPRRLTWREVVNDEELEDLDKVETLGRYGRRRSSGFQVVTSHNDLTEEPVPLVRGPTPPQRKSLLSQAAAKPLISGAASKRRQPRTPSRLSGGAKAQQQATKFWLDLERDGEAASPLQRMKSRTDSLRPPASPRRVVAHAPRSSKLHASPSRFTNSHDSPNPSPRRSPASSPAASPRGEDRPNSPKHSPRHPRDPSARRPRPRSRLS